MFGSMVVVVDFLTRDCVSGFTWKMGVLGRGLRGKRVFGEGDLKKGFLSVSEGTFW